MRVASVSAYAGPVDDDGLVPAYDLTVEPGNAYRVSGVVVSNSKRISLLDVNAMLSHGAVANLRDAGAIRGQNNPEYWTQFMQGHSPKDPKVPMAYEKFVAQLRSAGIRVTRDGPRTHLGALTKTDVDTMARHRELGSGETVDFDKGMRPVRGGLFDPSLTGGHGGCFHPSVRVWTEDGMERIGDLVATKKRVRVWSYDFASRQFQLKWITNWFENRSPEGIGRAKFAAGGRFGDRLRRFNPASLWGTRGHQVYRADGTKTDLAEAEELLCVTEKLSYTQSQFLYGGLLGDTYVTRHGRLSLTHCERQADYLAFKGKILGRLAGEQTTYFDTSGGSRRWKFRMNSRAHAEFRSARDLCYIAGRKTVCGEWLSHIDAMGLAFWLLDDGCTLRGANKNTTNVSLSVHAFSRVEVDMLSAWLSSRWGVESFLSRNHAKYGDRDCGWTIVVSGEHADWLLDLVAPYVPATMWYKLGQPAIAGACRECGAGITPRRRICNACSLSRARACGAGKLPRDVRRLFGGTAAIRELLATGETPPDVCEHAERYSARLAAAGEDVKRMEGDCETSLTLSSVPSRYEWALGRRWERTTAVYDIEVEDNHNYVANGVLVSNSLWSAIKLPEPMPNPAMEEPIRRMLGLTTPMFSKVLSGEEEIAGHGTGPKAIAAALEAIDVPKELEKARIQAKGGSAQARDQAVRRMGYLKGCEKTGLHPRDWVLDRVPVIPPVFRPVGVMDNGVPIVGDANYLYKELIDAADNSRKMKDLVGDEGSGPERLAVYHAFKGVTGLGDPLHPKLQEKNVKGALRSVFGDSPKHGTMQRKLLSGTVDNVGRAVIVPDPDLDMDSIGVPEAKAYDVYSKFVVRRLRRRGMTVRDALRHIKDRTELARETLQEEMEERPVFANRAPVLHKYGILAFRPRLVTGDVLKVSPLVVKGFNADFDGDMQISTVILLVDKNKEPDLVGAGVEAYNALQHLREGVMAARFDVSVWGFDPEKYEAYAVRLEDVPHGKKRSSNRNADFHSAPKGMYVLAHTPDGVSLAEVGGWSEHRDCEVVVVDLKSGRQLLTDDDPRAVYGMDRETYAMVRRKPSESIGLYVPRARTTPGAVTGGEVKSLTTGTACDRLWTSIDLDRRAGRLFGAWAGNGWVASADGGEKDVCLACGDDGVEARYRSDLSCLFVDDPHVCVRVRRGGDGFGDSKSLIVTSADAARFLSPIINKGARNKRLPPFAVFAPKSFRLGLVEGLWDTDGSISVSTGKTKSQLIVSYSTASLRLAQDVQHLLRTLGVSSRITPTKTPKGEPFWLLGVSTPEFYALFAAGKIEIAHSGKAEALRAAPPPDPFSASSASQDVVPVSWELCGHLMGLMNHKVRAEEGMRSAYAVLSRGKAHGSISRQAAAKIVERVGSLADHPHLETFKRIVADANLTWDEVTLQTPTGRIETGHDLTVPGPETFMSVDGVFLSNTMQFHVPSSAEEVKEAYDRMLPSKSLISPADFKTAVHAPIEEDFLGGLYHATRDEREDETKSSSRRTRTFRNLDDAKKALARGDITLRDRVKILE